MSKVYTAKEKKIKKLKITAIIFAVILLISAVFLALGLWERHQNQYPVKEEAVSANIYEHDGKEYQLREGIETVLVLGLDKYESNDSGSYNNDMQSDFMMLVVIDHNNKTASALHINRDTVAEMNILGVAGDKVGTVEKQIALAHTYGNGQEVSCRNAADAVSGLLLNIPIDHYVSVPMDAVSVYNDFVGGVEVTVLDDFTGVDDTLVKGETVTLYGDHALNYVRTRYGLSDSTNERRMERQRQYLDALYRKTLALINADEGFIAEAGILLADYIVSDFTGNGLQQLAEKVADYHFVAIYELEGESAQVGEHMEFYPDEESIKTTVIDLFCEEKK